MTDCSPTSSYHPVRNSRSRCSTVFALLLGCMAGGLLPFNHLHADESEPEPLNWATRRFAIEAAYAAQVVGANGIYLIASSHGGIPSLAWSPDGLVWQEGQVPVSRSGSYEYIAGAAFSDGIWAAVGSAGLVLLSSDNAKTWIRTPKVSNGAANFNGVLAVGEKFLGFGKEWKPDGDGLGGGGEVGGILISDDGGETWASKDSGTSLELLTAAANENAWIVAGQEGVILRSTDQGETWQEVASMFTGNFRAAAAGNGSFLLVGPMGLVLVSDDDGESWQEVFPSGEHWVEDVAFGDGVFVLSGGGSQTAGAVSYDGWNWIPPARLGSWGRMGHGPAGFLTVGGNYGYQTTIPNPPLVLPETNPFRITASTGRTPSAIFRSSISASTFIADNLPAGIFLHSTTGRFLGSTQLPGTFLSFVYALKNGQAGDVRSGSIEIRDSYSAPPEALIWEKQPSGLPENFYVQDTAQSEGTFVSVAESEVGRPMVARSGNGSDWELAEPPPGTPTVEAWGTLRCVAGGGGIWLASGRNGNLWRSVDDGLTWQTLPAVYSDTQEIVSLASDGQRFVAAGKAPRPGHGGEGAGCFVSEDGGETWVDAEMREHPPLRDVAFAGGVWVAVGERGIILRSSDAGETWEPVESGTFHTLRGVAGWNNIFVAIGEGGTVLRSIDGGEIWTDAEAGAGHWLTGVANAMGLFALSGGDEAAGSASRDGLQWASPSTGAAYGSIASSESRLVALNGGEVWVADGPWKSGVLSPEQNLQALVGRPFSVALTGSGSPTLFHATGLPPGLSLDPLTGVISGIPRSVRSFILRVFATNQAGKGPITLVRIQVEAPFGKVAGRYFGLFDPAESLNAGAGGSMQITLAPLGTFSGRLINGIEVHSFRGKLDDTGSATVKILRRNRATLQIDLTVGTEGVDEAKLTAELTDGVSTSNLEGWRFAWNARTNPAPAWSGIYNAALECTDTTPPVPGELGFAVLNVRTAGTVRVTGLLPNGLTFAAATNLSPEGKIPLHLGIRPRGTTLHGEAAIDNTTEDRPVSGTWNWIQPVSVSSPEFQTDLIISGARYLRPPKGVRVIDIPDGENNAFLEAEDLGEKFVTVSAINRATWIRDGGLVSLVLNPAAGNFRGSFSPQGTTRRIAFRGLLITGQIQQGIGLYLLPRVTGQPPQSRPVFLQATEAP